MTRRHALRPVRVIDPRPVFLFGDHSAESTGMAAALLEADPRRFDGWFERAEAASDLAIRPALAAGPAAALATTELAQPALLSISLALADSAASQGLRARFVAGHGLGGYAAAAVAGVLRPEHAMRLAAERGRLIAAAERQQSGTMAFILGASLDTVAYICALVRERHGYVSLAQANSPRHAVVSGNASSVANAVARARRQGATAGILPARAACNSLLMARVQAGLARVASTMRWRDASVPLISGMSGRPLTSGSDIRAALIHGETLPIHWTRCMTALLDQQCRQFLELGPGRTLTALARQHAPEALAIAADGPARISMFRERAAAARQDWSSEDRLAV